jgi:hypothetical protein
LTFADVLEHTLAPPPSLLFGPRRFHVQSTPYATLPRSDFTPRELRTAFRRPARQYHPDGHPGSSDAEKARLARTFSDVDDYYELLRDVQPA